MAEQPRTSVWPTLIAGLVLTLYPLLVYVGLQHLNPRWLALTLLLAAGLRLLGGQLPASTLFTLAAAVVIATGLTLATGDELGLLLYPVLMNAMLLILFVASWFYPPAMIERLARLREPDLPPEAVAYTRKLTLVWALFFALNGTIAAITIGLGRDLWTLYNGLIAYVLIGTLFGAERLVRKRVMHRHQQGRQRA
jgi:uncharacterized membrane protein